MVSPPASPLPPTQLCQSWRPRTSAPGTGPGWRSGRPELGSADGAWEGSLSATARRSPACVRVLQPPRHGTTNWVASDTETLCLGPGGQRPTSRSRRATLLLQALWGARSSLSRPLEAPGQPRRSSACRCIARSCPGCHMAFPPCLCVCISSH